MRGIGIILVVFEGDVRVGRRVDGGVIVVNGWLLCYGIVMLLKMSEINDTSSGWFSFAFGTQCLSRRIKPARHTPNPLPTFRYQL